MTCMEYIEKHHWNIIMMILKNYSDIEGLKAISEALSETNVDVLYS